MLQLQSSHDSMQQNQDIFLAPERREQTKFYFTGKDLQQLMFLVAIGSAIIELCNYYFLDMWTYHGVWTWLFVPQFGWGLTVILGWLAWSLIILFLFRIVKRYIPDNLAEARTWPNKNKGYFTYMDIFQWYLITAAFTVVFEMLNYYILHWWTYSGFWLDWYIPEWGFGITIIFGWLILLTGLIFLMIVARKIPD